MVGYSALSQRDDKLALELLEEHRRLLREGEDSGLTVGLKPGVRIACGAHSASEHGVQSRESVRWSRMGYQPGCGSTEFWVGHT